MVYLSIIIPVRNEERFIVETLKMLVNQDYPKERFELIVVDGRSTDHTRNEVCKFINQHVGMNIRLLDNPGYLSSRGRNIGVWATRGQLLGVVDGHVYIPNGQLFRNMERFKEENHALCLARPAPLDVPGLRDGIPFWIAVARKNWLGHSQNSFIYSHFEGFVDPMSSGFAYDRSVFERVGYFDESFDAAEDVEFHFRLKQAGIQAYTSPGLLIYSYPRESLSSLFHQQVRYGIGRARLVKKHAGALTKETPIPALIFLFWAVLPLVVVLSLWFPSIGIAYAAVMVLYWVILLIAGLGEALPRKRFFPGFLVAAATWVTHMGLGWGFLKTILFATRTQWEEKSDK
jgi:succinoglycan biosynthesis protein ExoA